MLAANVPAGNHDRAPGRAPLSLPSCHLSRQPKGPSSMLNQKGLNLGTDMSRGLVSSQARRQAINDEFESR